MPTYIPRDIDIELHERLSRSAFVLLIGDSTAGKSRSAYEAIKTTLPNHIFIAPRNREALTVAISQAAEENRCVLWLNDLEHYLGLDGITKDKVARILGGSNHHRVILATLRSAEETRLTGGPEGSEETARQAHKLIQETIEQAHPIRLNRLFTATERTRAQQYDWDPRINDALARSGEYGIPEYMSAGPHLLRDWENAWSPNTDPGAPTHPRGAALIAAAIDIHRAGHISPIPRNVLEAVHDHYLTERGGVRLRPEALEEAWSWCLRPRYATTALLQPYSDERIRAFDYLTDSVQRNSPHHNFAPESVVRAILLDCAAQDAESIASTAHFQGRYKLAETGFLIALRERESTLGSEHPDTLASRSNRAAALHGLGRFQEAEAEHRAVVVLRTRVLGAQHPRTLVSRDNHAITLHWLGRFEEAETEYRAVVELQTRILGPDHPNTLSSRSNHAMALQGLGRFEEAEIEHRVVIDLQARTLGPQHPVTLVSRNNHATALYHLGRLEEAEKAHKVVVELRTQTLGPEHPDTLVSRDNHAITLYGLRRFEEAQDEHRAVVELQTRILGPQHPDTLVSRSTRAMALYGLGRFEEAESEYRAVVDIQTRILGPEHPGTLSSRSNRAAALHGLGQLEEAEGEFRAVVSLRSQVLGPHHPDTLVSRSNRAAVLRGLGRTAEADAERSAALGPEVTNRRR
jgi:tetratricopeptide (TPR) repeat protein